MTLTKTYTVEDDVLAILKQMRWEEQDNNGIIVGFLPPQQLERTLYVRVNEVLEKLGGKWDRKSKGHIFYEDPRSEFSTIVEEAAYTVERDGYFITPKEIGYMMAELAGLKPHMRVLEPSAGTGELAMAIRGIEPNVDLCVGEKNPARYQHLRKNGWSCVTQEPYDFLTYAQGEWDAIIQNPPFEELQDIDHVLHAYGLLKPGGVLVSVLSSGTLTNSRKKARDFQDWLFARDPEIIELGHGAFHDSGTDVSATVIKVVVDGAE